MRFLALLHFLQPLQKQRNRLAATLAQLDIAPASARGDRELGSDALAAPVTFVNRHRKFINGLPVYFSRVFSLRNGSNRLHDKHHDEYS